jgi:hypothetical protein
MKEAHGNKNLRTTRFCHMYNYAVTLKTRLRTNVAEKQYKLVLKLARITIFSTRKCSWMKN